MSLLTEITNRSDLMVPPQTSTKSSLGTSSFCPTLMDRVGAQWIGPAGSGAVVPVMFRVSEGAGDQWSDERGGGCSCDSTETIIFILISNQRSIHHGSIKHRRHQRVLTFPVLKRFRFFCSDASDAAGSPGCGRVSSRLKSRCGFRSWLFTIEVSVCLTNKITPPWTGTKDKRKWMEKCSL